MLRDSGARVAVVAAGVDAAVDVAGPAASVRNVISLDTMGALVGDPDSSASSAPSALPYEGDLAYVIYTSGTTGRPKGVLVEHGGLANMAAAHEEVLHPHSAPPSRRVALNAVTTADTFFSDFVNLAAGRTLVVVDDESRRDPERLARFLTDNRIDVFDATPTQLRTLLLGAGTAALESLQVLVIGNEPADADLWRTLRGLPGVRVHNFYGPTECTVDVTSAIVSENEFPVIGKPLAGSEIWLVDSALRPVSDGEAGEICVAGRCLARGYLNAHDDDAARFTQLQIRPDGATTRVYRTGDRARRGPSGQLEFLGRVDDQVKISGYRVEPREVEATLRSCPGVLDAAVGVRDRDSAATLAAWVVLTSDVQVHGVLRVLRSALPSYMVPTLHAVPRIPMGPSGKADVAALLEQTGPAATGEASPSLDALHAIWCDVLGVANVGAADDFFSLGGDSLKATRMIVAVRRALAPQVPIRTIFDNPSFGAFADAVTGKAGH